MRYLLLFFPILLLVSCGTQESATTTAETNGAIPTFQNPVLTRFYPDPALCNANGQFYLTTSTFAYFPGLPIFTSNDLVSWKQIGNAMDRPSQIIIYSPI